MFVVVSSQTFVFYATMFARMFKLIFSIQSCEFYLCAKLEYRIKHLQTSTVSIQRIKENKIITTW